jgi:hypothetical protein
LKGNENEIINGVEKIFYAQKNRTVRSVQKEKDLFNMEKRTYDIKQKKLILGTLITFFAFSMKLDIPDLSDVVFPTKQILLNFSGSFVDFNVIHTVLLPGIYLIYRYATINVCRRERLSKSVIIPALIFSLFMVLGYSYKVLNSWNLIFGLSNGQILKTVFISFGYFIFFTYVISSLYFVFDHYCINSNAAQIERKPEWNYFSFFRNNPFFTVFFTLVLVFLPYAVVSYPAIFMGDSPDQVLDGFTQVTQLHSIVHTLFIHGCILIGKKAFDSFNSGIFIYSLTQTLAFIFAVSFSISKLFQKKVISEKHILLFELYFFFNPLIHSYLFLVTKDIFYTVFLLIFFVYFFCLLKDNGDKKAYIGMIIGCIGIITFRNEGWLILLLSFLFIAIFSSQFKKPAAVIIICTIFFHFFVLRVLCNILDYPPGSKGEMFSLPFQQTARYVYDHSKEVTKMERDAIDKVLPYEKILQYYDPVSCVSVKTIYRKDAGNQDLIDYFKVWGEMLLKHPETYLQALLNSKYLFFFPCEIRIDLYTYEWSETMMGVINESLEKYGGTFSYPKETIKFRILSDKLNNNGRFVPGITIFTTPAFYIWKLLLLFFYGIKKKNNQTCILLSPLFVLCLALMTGPENAYYGRYLYPLAVVMPYLLFMVLSLTKNGME